MRQTFGPSNDTPHDIHLSLGLCKFRPPQLLISMYLHLQGRGETIATMVPQIDARHWMSSLKLPSTMPIALLRQLQCPQ